MRFSEESYADSHSKAIVSQRDKQGKGHHILEHYFYVLLWDYITIHTLNTIFIVINNWTKILEVWCLIGTTCTNSCSNKESLISHIETTCTHFIFYLTFDSSQHKNILCDMVIRALLISSSVYIYCQLCLVWFVYYPLMRTTNAVFILIDQLVWYNHSSNHILLMYCSYIASRENRL